MLSTSFSSSSRLLLLLRVFFASSSRLLRVSFVVEFCFFFFFFISFFLFFFVNVVLISSGSVQIRPSCPEAKDVLNNIIGLVNAVNKVATLKGCEKAFGKMRFVLHASVARRYAWKL